MAVAAYDFNLNILWCGRKYLVEMNQRKKDKKRGNGKNKIESHVLS